MELNDKPTKLPAIQIFEGGQNSLGLPRATDNLFAYRQILE